MANKTTWEITRDSLQQHLKQLELDLEINTLLLTVMNKKISKMPDEKKEEKPKSVG